MEPKWREVWARLDIAYDDYIRTTEPRHTAAVEKLLSAVHDNGRDDIYLGTLRGPVLRRAARRTTPRASSIDGNCARSTAGRSSSSARRTTSSGCRAYADRLLEHYERHPEAVQPDAGATRCSAFDPRRAPGLLDQPHPFTGASRAWDPSTSRTSGSTR